MNKYNTSILFKKCPAIIYVFLIMKYPINVMCTTFPNVGFMVLKWEIVYFPYQLPLDYGKNFPVYIR